MRGKKQDDPELHNAVIDMQSAASNLIMYADTHDPDDPFTQFCRSTAKSLYKRADKLSPPGDEWPKDGKVVPMWRSHD